jgi:hypothetical protein
MKHKRAEAEHRSTFYIPYWNVPLLRAIVPRQRAFAADMAVINATLDGLITNARETRSEDDYEALQARDYSQVGPRRAAGCSPPCRLACLCVRDRHNTKAGPWDLHDLKPQSLEPTPFRPRPRTLAPSNPAPLRPQPQTPKPQTPQPSTLNPQPLTLTPGPCTPNPPTPDPQTPKPPNPRPPGQGPLPAAVPG